MKDLIARLRELSRLIHRSGEWILTVPHSSGTCRDAADAIEKLWALYEAVLAMTNQENRVVGFPGQELVDVQRAFDAVEAASAAKEESDAAGEKQ